MIAKVSSSIIALLLLVATVQAAPATEPATQAAKPWVEDWATFVSDSRARGWQMLRAESGDACVTIEEAREQAVAMAADQIEHNLTPQIARRFNLPVNYENAVRQEIIASLSRGELIKDQFLKKIDKPYGTLWKQYILLDAAQIDMASLVGRISRQVKIDSVAHVAGWASLAALTVVILLVYAFLNSATKGYFVWRLRTAAILIVIVAVLTVFAVL